ncbi:MAG: Arginyl-tRNA--protein transferase 1 [Cirrosporium novae-zelandiae]|nr:MAG: Arginyl-tRNA--protein transferase 1 [Cirrosporium novae-zelandiae]
MPSFTWLLVLFYTPFLSNESNLYRWIPSSPFLGSEDRKGYWKSSCGYCKSPTPSSFSYHAASENCHPQHYKDLMDRGWRRSGDLYYKPDLGRSCCPQYTIRLDGPAFRPTREQRQAVNRWNKSVLGQEYIDKAARLCPLSREEKRFRKQNFDPVHEIHRCEYDGLKRPVDPKTKQPIEPAHRFEVTLEPDEFTEEKHALLLRYQTSIHHDPPTRWTARSFKNFLCSGFKKLAPNTTTPTSPAYGSYHQCYRLDGKLIAIGVLDLLPSAVSSVYLIYDPDLSPWAFGKLSAVREAALATEHGFRWYYMGFYIHSCDKMRYKGEYQPSYLLDPETYAWNPLDAVLKTRLDLHPYVTTNSPTTAPTPSTTTNSTTNPTPTSTIPTLHDLNTLLHPQISVLHTQMPGTLTPTQLSTEINLGDIFFQHRQGVYQLKDLMGWEEQDFLDVVGGLKGRAAEFAACVGVGVLKGGGVGLKF